MRSMRVLVASAVALWCQAGQQGLINGIKTQNPPPACLHKALGIPGVVKRVIGPRHAGLEVAQQGIDPTQLRRLRPWRPPPVT